MTRSRRPAAHLAVPAALVASLLGTLAFPSFALAHGALSPKTDLPIPPWLFAWGAAVVLIVSFVALSVSWREPRFEDLRWRAGGMISRLVVNRVTEVLAGAIGVFLFGVTIWAGLYGTASSAANFTITFVFVTFYIGLVIVSFVLGDVFRAFNPWRAIARVASRGFALIAGSKPPPPPPLTYPERVGRWPAVVGLAAFLWLELAYGVPFEPVVILEPRVVAIAALIYSAYTFVGMALFGIDKWCERGETFSVYFNMFSRVSPIEVRDGKLGFRGWFKGAVGWGVVPGSIAMIMVTVAGTTYDGAAEGLLAGPLDSLFDLLSGGPDGSGEVLARRAAASTFMIATALVISGVFLAGIRGMGSEGTDGRSIREVARSFSHCFIPIAFAYILAHYFSLVVFQEQAQFTYLLSDPLGNGSDYFGTADGTVDLGVISAEFVWYVQVAALVGGHVAALAMGHDRALATYKTLRRATQSQYWMLALMVSFTVLGLMLLSSSNQ